MTPSEHSRPGATAPTRAPAAEPPTALQPEDFDALDAILDDVRTRHPETPDWEYCDGFLAALACTRRPVPSAECLPVLLGAGAAPADDAAPLVQAAGAGGEAEAVPVFSGPIQQRRFLALWERRRDETAARLDADVETLDDPRAYAPEVVDMRGMAAAAAREEGAALDPDALPSLGELWAHGFLDAVEHWADDWTPPRDPETAAWIGECLDAIAALAAPDPGPLTEQLSGPDQPAGASAARLDTFAQAIWSACDLHRIWQSVGPASGPLRAAPRPGRNDPCPCGSGAKYKKCCGA